MIAGTLTTMTDLQADFKLCAACGRTLRDGEWHPVSTETNEESDSVLYSFCDEDCQSTWAASESDPLLDAA